MNPFDPLFWALDFAPLAIGVLASIACALPGNFLLLRRQALISDAISHVVLPGIVVAFFVTGTLASAPMLLGAGAAALVAAVLIEAIRRLGRVEPGAAMGVVFTVMFAAGVLALELGGAGRQHLDVHIIEGALERMIWPAASGPGALFDLEALAQAPPALGRVLAAAAMMTALTIAFWRPLTIATFDEGYASAIGLPVGAIGFGLVVAAAVAAVAAFEAIGPILAIAMFICPPATARLLTDDLRRQVALSAVIAAASSIIGYALAWDLNAAGMIATVSGVFLGLACLFGPRRRRLGHAVRGG